MPSWGCSSQPCDESFKLKEVAILSERMAVAPDVPAAHFYFSTAVELLTTSAFVERAVACQATFFQAATMSDAGRPCTRGPRPGDNIQPEAAAPTTSAVERSGRLTTSTSVWHPDPPTISTSATTLRRHPHRHTPLNCRRRHRLLHRRRHRHRRPLRRRNRRRYRPRRHRRRRRYRRLRTRLSHSSSLLAWP